MFQRLLSTLRKPTKSIITIVSIEVSVSSHTIQLPNAESQLKKLYEGKDRLLRLSLKKKGCSGLSYSLEFTNEPSKFDEIVEHNGNNDSKRKHFFIT